MILVKITIQEIYESGRTQEFALAMERILRLGATEEELSMQKLLKNKIGPNIYHKRTGGGVFMQTLFSFSLNLGSDAPSLGRSGAAAE